MNKQDKLYQEIKNAAEKQERQTFQNKNEVWKNVSDKLNHKKSRPMFPFKIIGAAAVVAIIIFAGFQLNQVENPFQQNEIINREIPFNENEIITSSEDDEIEESTETDFDKSNGNLKKKSDEVMLLDADKAAESKVDSDATTEESLLEDANEMSTSAKIATKHDTIVYTKRAAISSKIQAKLIEGNVVDTDGFNLPGVNVQVIETNKGVQTDYNGNFSITAEIGQTLEFSFSGFKKEKFKIENTQPLKIIMQPKLVNPNQDIVFNYDNKEKDKTLPAPPPPAPAPEVIEVVEDEEEVEEKIIESAEYSLNEIVEEEEIEDVPFASVSKTLQGRTAGVAISSNSGAPGATNNIRIRGVGSISGSQEPLYIIDGKPTNGNKIKGIDPEKINSIKVLKNANATALYGSKGANGVIIILTKNANTEQKKTFDSIVSIPNQPIIPNNEDYETYKENPFTCPLSDALSTFSIDVDRAAYTNIRRFINNGQEVPKDAVRIEEMLNFFEYDYNKPNSRHPFAIHTEYSEAPWNKGHKLLRIALQGKDIPMEELPASNLVFLIDVSGSMNSQNKLPLVKKSLNLLVEQMRKKDKIALVTYAGNSQVVLEPTSGSEKTKIKNAIENLTSGGGTHASQGVETAYQLAEENFIKDGNNRVIVATDGDFNIGVTKNESLEELIAKKRETNIFLTCLGYGMGNYKDSKMQSLSQKGNGNSAYIDSYQEAQKFLEREFKGSLYAIAKDVKIQIEFNPKHVQSYRLIGYETRMLKARDFDDDTKDAGEIGVNHQVTALYEVVPRGVDSPFGEFKPDLKYQKVEQPSFENNSDELATVKFRYKPPTSDKSIKMERVIKNESTSLEKSSSDFKFATAVAWFGLKLRDSQLITITEKEELIKLAKQGLANDKEGYRAEFVRLVKLSE